MPLSFAQAQVIVAMSAGIAHEKLGSLTSRMKQWQKMGFPVGTKGVGKGAKAEYGASQIFQLLLMVRFLKLGVTPERAKEIIFVGWDQFRNGIFRTLLSNGDNDGSRHYFLVQLDALSDLTTPGADHMHVVVDCVSSAEICTAWQGANLTAVRNVRDLADEDEIVRWGRAFIVKNRMSGCFVMEVDSLIYWVWLCLREMGISPSIFAEEFEVWFHEVWKGFEGNQPDEDEFLAYRNRSAAEHDVGKLDLAACAREAMSLVLDKHSNGLD